MRVKICGLCRRSDAELAIDCGADALGFVLEPSSPRNVGDRLDWIGSLPAFPARVGVFGVYRQLVHRGLFDAVQAVEWETFNDPSPRRIHVLRVRAGQRADDLSDITVNCSMVVLDAHHEGAYGGTGSKIDWDVAAEFVQRCPKPVVLAGGLTPDNVADAVRRVRPYAVDVSSGVEAQIGAKDALKVRDFIAAAKGA
jgi:phosphoribosylanthranilate isomerase